MFGKGEKKKAGVETGGLVKVARVRDVKPGQIAEFTASKAKIALANVDGQIYAFSPWCPHQGWPLWSGDLKGELVRCYLHRWQFNVCSGENIAPGGVPVKLSTYPVQIIEQEIWVDITKALEEQTKK